MCLTAANCSGDDEDRDSDTSTPPAPAVTPDTSPDIVDDAVEPEPPAATATDAADAAETPDDGADVPEPRWATGDSDELFDQDALHTFEINLPEESLAFLDADPAAEEYVEGSLTFDGETVEPIGVRYKGSVGAFVGCTTGGNPMAPSGPKACTKLSLKLKINWEDESNREFYGVRAVLLHSQNLDPTLMHERLGYWLFREMGVPAPRSTHARVIVNGEYVGVFALTEDVDGRFTRDRFDDGTGNLYKEVWPFDDEGQPATDDALLDGLETNEDEDPSAEIMTAFAAELAAAAPEDRADVIEKWSDVDLLLRTFVVDRAIKNDDGALHWYCIPGKEGCGPHNFYWYEDPSAKEIFFIPWDLDNAFDILDTNSFIGQFTKIADPWGETQNDCLPFPYGSFGIPQRSAACDPIIGALSSLDDEFDRLRADFVAGPFSEEQVNALLDEWAAQIEPAVAEAAETNIDAPSVEEWRAALQRLKDGLAMARTGDGR